MDEFHFPPHVADGPAERMSMEAFRRHLGQTVVIRVQEPELHLSQGSWLRCRRANISATIREIINTAPGNVRLSVIDVTGVTAADLRRQSLLARTTCPTCGEALAIAGAVKVCPNECFVIAGEVFAFREEGE